jgi:hypothetical protein
MSAPEHEMIGENARMMFKLVHAVYKQMIDSANDAKGC